MGGIIPNKEDGITPGLLWPITFPGGTTYDLQDPTSFGGLTERLSFRNQPNVVEILKEQVKQFPEWTDAANQVFDGLRRGVAGGENVPLPLAIIESLASQITGLPPGTWSNINAVVADLNALPGIPQITALITNTPAVAINDTLTVLSAYGSNLGAFLADVDFTSPTFSVANAATAFVNLVLAPLNLIPTLVGGVIPALNIPPLDASQIVTGTFAAPLMQPLTDAISQGFGGGSGLGFSGLQSLLGGLPTAQALTDAIGAGLGHLAGGYTPADVTSFLGVIPGGNIASVLASSVIPNLDLSKITTGFASGIASWLGGGGALPGATTLGVGALTGLAGGMGAWLSAAGAIPAAATLQGSQLLGSVASSLLSGTIANAIIPNLDLSKITTGFGTGVASWLGSGGALPTATTAVASQIISGVLGAGLIPGLDASKIISGAFGTSLIPALPTSKITSGTFASQFFPMFALQQSAATNLVLDPSVENSTAWAWTINNSAGAQVFSTEQAHSGTHSLKTIGPNAVYLNTSDVGLNAIKSRPGESWRIGMWIYPAAANLANAGGVYFDLNCTGPTGTFTTNLAGANLAPTLVKGQWNYVEQVLTVPAGSWSFNPLFWSPGIPTGDIYYIDDTLVREETQPQNIIQQLWGSVGAVPSLALNTALTISSKTLGNIVTNITSAGALLSSGLSGLIGTGLIPNLDLSKITTGFGTGIASWLGAGGALPGSTTLGVGGLTGLASGIGAWLSSSGAIPTAATMQGSQIISAIASSIVPNIDLSKITTGFASGIASWLGSGGALPSATRIDTSALTGLITTTQAPWAASQDVLAAAWGGSAGMTVSQFQSLAASVPATAVNGMFGAANMEAAVQAYLDSHVQGLTGINTLINQGTAQIQSLQQQFAQFVGWNYSNPAAPQSGSVAAQTNANNANLNNRAVQKPPYANIDPTTDATFEFKEVWQNSTAPTIAITQASGAVLGDITIRDGGPKQAVTWYGFPSGGTLANITGLFINIFSVNLTTNVRTPVYQSPNCIASVVTGTTPKFNSYSIPAANYLNTAGTQGVKYTAELYITGTGTYNLVAQTIAPWVDFHPTYGLHGESRVSLLYDNQQAAASTSFGTTPGSLSSTINIDARSTYLVVHATALRTVGTATPAMTMTVGTGASQKTLTAAAQFSYTDTRGYLIQQWAFVVANPPTGAAQALQLNQGTSGITWGLSFVAMSYIGPNGYGTPQFNSGGSATSGSLTATSGAAGGLTTVSFTSAGTTISSVSGTGYNGRSSALNTGAASVPLWAGDANGSASNTFGETLSGTATGWGILELPLIVGPPTTFTPTTGVQTQANPVPYSRVVPWIGLSGIAATPVYQPVTKTFNSGIGQSFDPATFAPWANYVDVMQWADGSAGAPGSPTNSGAGGGAGGAQAITLSKSQFTSGAWTLDVGPGGTNVAAAQQNRVVIPGYGTRTVAGAGPQVASGSINQGDTGANGATISYTDAHGVTQSYSGGSGGVGPTGNGGTPGAGGSGGAVFWYGSGTPGNGAPGQTLLRFYQ